MARRGAARGPGRSGPGGPGAARRLLHAGRLRRHDLVARGDSGGLRRHGVRIGCARAAPARRSPRRDLATIYPAADALLLPTRYDAFANVCLEATAAGLPVVTSGANGAAEPFREAGAVGAVRGAWHSSLAAPG